MARNSRPGFVLLILVFFLQLLRLGVALPTSGNRLAGANDTDSEDNDVAGAEEESEEDSIGGETCDEPESSHPDGNEHVAESNEFERLPISLQGGCKSDALTLQEKFEESLELMRGENSNAEMLYPGEVRFFQDVQARTARSHAYLYQSWSTCTDNEVKKSITGLLFDAFKEIVLTFKLWNSNYANAGNDGKSISFLIQSVDNVKAQLLSYRGWLRQYSFEESFKIDGLLQELEELSVKARENKVSVYWGESSLQNIGWKQTEEISAQLLREAELLENAEESLELRLKRGIAYSRRILNLRESATSFEQRQVLFTMINKINAIIRPMLRQFARDPNASCSKYILYHVWYSQLQNGNVVQLLEVDGAKITRQQFPLIRSSLEEAEDLVGFVSRKFSQRHILDWFSQALRSINKDLREILQESFPALMRGRWFWAALGLGALLSVGVVTAGIMVIGYLGFRYVSNRLHTRWKKQAARKIRAEITQKVLRVAIEFATAQEDRDNVISEEVLSQSISYDQAMPKELVVKINNQDCSRIKLAILCNRTELLLLDSNLATKFMLGIGFEGGDIELRLSFSEYITQKGSQKIIESVQTACETSAEMINGIKRRAASKWKDFFNKNKLNTIDHIERVEIRGDNIVCIFHEAGYNYLEEYKVDIENVSWNRLSEGGELIFHVIDRCQSDNIYTEILADIDNCKREMQTKIDAQIRENRELEEETEGEEEGEEEKFDAVAEAKRLEPYISVIYRDLKSIVAILKSCELVIYKVSENKCTFDLRWKLGTKPSKQEKLTELDKQDIRDRLPLYGIERSKISNGVGDSIFLFDVDSAELELTPGDEQSRKLECERLLEQELKGGLCLLYQIVAKTEAGFPISELEAVVERAYGEISIDITQFNRKLELDVVQKDIRPEILKNLRSRLSNLVVLAIRGMGQRYGSIKGQHQMSIELKHFRTARDVKLFTQNFNRNAAQIYKDMVIEARQEEASMLLVEQLSAALCKTYKIFSTNDVESSNLGIVKKGGVILVDLTDFNSSFSVETLQNVRLEYAENFLTKLPNLVHMAVKGMRRKHIQVTDKSHFSITTATFKNVKHVRAFIHRFETKRNEVRVRMEAECRKEVAVAWFVKELPSVFNKLCSSASKTSKLNMNIEQTGSRVFIDLTDLNQRLPNLMCSAVVGMKELDFKKDNNNCLIVNVENFNNLTEIQRFVIKFEGQITTALGNIMDPSADVKFQDNKGRLSQRGVIAMRSNFFGAGRSRQVDDNVMIPVLGSNCILIALNEAMESLNRVTKLHISTAGKYLVRFYMTRCFDLLLNFANSREGRFMHDLFQHITGEALDPKKTGSLRSQLIHKDIHNDVLAEYAVNFGNSFPQVLHKLCAHKGTYGEFKQEIPGKQIKLNLNRLLTADIYSYLRTFEKDIEHKLQAIFARYTDMQGYGIICRRVRDFIDQQRKFYCGIMNAKHTMGDLSKVKNILGTGLLQKVLPEKESSQEVEALLFMFNVTEEVKQPLDKCIKEANYLDPPRGYWQTQNELKTLRGDLKQLWQSKEVEPHDRFYAIVEILILIDAILRDSPDKTIVAQYENTYVDMKQSLIKVRHLKPGQETSLDVVLHAKQVLEDDNFIGKIISGEIEINAATVPVVLTGYSM